MIHELRLYDLAPGMLPRYLDLAEKQVPIARGDRFGRLVGFWTAAAGNPERVLHVWEYDSLDARQAGRDALFRERAWLDDFIAHVWPIIDRQQVVFLEPRGPMRPPTTGTHLYELRTTHARTGTPKQTHDALAAQALRAGTTRVAGWTGIAPWPNSVVELFAHADTAAVMKAHARAPAGRDPATAEAVAGTRIDTEWLVPIAISPLT